MKKIVLAVSMVASALVLASCASKGTTSMDQGAMASNAPAQTATVSHHHRHHHDYKGEMSK